MADKKPELSDDEMRGILAEIARNSTNAAARIAAIKELRALDAGDDDEELPSPPDHGDERSTSAQLIDLHPRRYKAK